MQIDRRHGDPREIGKIAEDEACRYLRHRGLKLVARNYRCRCGEIDLIMKETETLVFVEVRYRRSAAFGSGAETVTRAKQGKIAQSAAYFLQENRQYAGSAARFDVVSCSPDQGGGGVRWIQDAFHS
jgi:putative endonuclease